MAACWTCYLGLFSDELRYVSCLLPEAVLGSRMSTSKWPQWITLSSKKGSRWRHMLGPVLEGGATDLLLDCVGHSVKSLFIAIRFLPDSTSEKRIERGSGQSLRHTEQSYCSRNLTGFFFGLCLFFVEWQWDYVVLKSRRKTLRCLRVGKRWVSFGAAYNVLWEYSLQGGGCDLSK